MTFGNSNEEQHTAVTNSFYLSDFVQRSFQQADTHSNSYNYSFYYAVLFIIILDCASKKPLMLYQESKIYQ